jgi:hypothetical protein
LKRREEYIEAEFADAEGQAMDEEAATALRDTGIVIVVKKSGRLILRPTFTEPPRNLHDHLINHLNHLNHLNHRDHRDRLNHLNRLNPAF